MRFLTIVNNVRSLVALRLAHVEVNATYPATQTLTATSRIAVQSGIAVDLITITAASAITLTSAPSIQTTGISDRQQITIVNIGTFPITLQTSATLAGSAILADQAVTISPGRADCFLYSSALNGWIALSPGGMANQNANAVVITGGSIDGVAIGANSGGSVRCTTFTSVSGTDSTSTSTGALLLSGGAGISKSISIGGMIRAIAGLIFPPSTAQALTATSTINPNAGCVQVTSTSAIVLTSNPQISAVAAGQVLYLYNAGSFAITLVDGNGLALPYGIRLLPGDWVRLVFIGSAWRLDDLELVPAWIDVTYQNSFSNVTNREFQYSKNRGEVTLRGIAQRSTTGLSTGMTIAQLPVGFRPPKLVRVVLDSLGNPSSYVDIDPNGTITYNYTGTPGVGGIVYPSFDHVRFYAA